MRIMRLLLIMLVVVTAGRTAASQEFQAQHPNRFSKGHDYVRPLVPENSPAPFSFKGDAAPQRRFNLAEEDGLFPKKRVVAAPESNLCLTMHSLKVVRPNKHSDATVVVGQSTCTPADRFRTKAAVAQPAPAN